MNLIDITALINKTATIETKIEVLPRNENEDVLVLKNNESILSWDYNDIRYVPDKGFIGMFVERTIEGVLDNISEDFNIENREIILYLGIRRYVPDYHELVTEIFENLTTEDSIVLGTDQKLGDYITTFYSLGNFIVDKPDSDEVKDNTKFTAKDYTINFNKMFNADYTDSEFAKSFNQMLQDGDEVTALWLTEYTCKQADVELGSKSFTNSDFIIPSNQFQNGEECRDVLKYIGKLAYSWVRIDWDNKVYIDFTLKTSVENDYNNITKDDYYTLEVQKEKYGVVNKIVLGSSVITGDYSYIEDSNSIAENGENVLTINDNPILYTEELRELALLPANIMFGLTYTPLVATTTGHPWLKGNELISFEDKNNNLVYTYPFDRIIHFNGHIKTDIASYALTKVEEDFSYKGTSTSLAEKRNAYINLDREKQRIQALIEKTNNQESKISSLTIDLDGINTTVSNTTKVVEDLENSIDILTVDMDSYNIVVPVTENKKPIETKDYTIKFYGYFKGSQVTPSANTSTADVDGISLSFGSTQMIVSVDSDTIIPNTNNEFNINFIYQDNDKVYTVSKRLTVTLASQGVKGNDGTGVTILGSYDTEEDLRAEHPTGNMGDAYLVAGSLYVWSATKNDWENVGNIQGTPGKDGVSTYFYVRYSANSDGSDMTLSPTDTTEYIGVLTSTSPTPPTSYNSYTWSKIKGQDGTNGTPGVNGANGETSYLHIKYSEDGSTFTPADDDFEIGERPSAYVGQYVDFVEEDSDDFNRYKWYKFTEDIDDELTELDNKISENKITTENNYKDIIGKLDNYASIDSVTSIKTSVETLQTDTSQVINIVRDIQVNGVSQVKTEKGFTFDDNGMTVDETNSKTKSVTDTDGVHVIDKTGSTDTDILFAGYDEELGSSVVRTNNLSVSTYFNMGTHSRMEDYLEDATAVFYVG